MKIYTFIDTFCQDIIKKSKEKKSLVDLSGFPCDAVIKSPDGKEIPIVYVDDIPVPVMDVLTMERADFLNTHKLQSAGLVYDNYLMNFVILEGEDALHRIRNAIKEEKEELDKVNMGLLDMMCYD